MDNFLINNNHLNTLEVDPFLQSHKSPQKLLSILCFVSNEECYGDSSWRLSVVLNKYINNLRVLNGLKDVEVLIADWGNSDGVYNRLELSPDAKTYCKFVSIPKSITNSIDSRVKKRVAVNSLAKRAGGKYLMYTDSNHFLPLDSIANLLFHLRKGYFEDYSLDESFFTATRRCVSKEIVKDSNYSEDIDKDIQNNFSSYKVERIDRKNLICNSSTFLVSKDIWNSTCGWSESTDAKSLTSTEWHKRLLEKYRWNDLDHYGVKFFNLEYENSVNHENDISNESTNSVNSSSVWGLGDKVLKITDGRGLRIDPISRESASSLEVIKSTVQAPMSVRTIIETNAVYRNLTSKFEFDSGSWFCNADQITQILTQLKPKNVCEVGSWLGASARHFAKHDCVEKLYCVDHWDRERVENYVPGGMPEFTMNNIFEIFMSNAAHENVDHKIYPIRRSSQEAIDYCNEFKLKFDLIYIDGEHSTRGVERDIKLWIPLLAENGLICGDDWTWQEEPNNVAGAVNTVAEERGLKVLAEGNFWIMLPQSVVTHSASNPSI